DGSGGVALEPGMVEFPNLSIELSEISAQTWFDWHKSFVIDGDNGDDIEKNGSLQFLASDLKTELSRIEFRHLGIVRLVLIPGPADKITRVRAELYCEEMSLSRPGGSP